MAKVKVVFRHFAKAPKNQLGKSMQQKNIIIVYYQNYMKKKT